MNPYIMPCVCSVCGEEGVTTFKDFVGTWRGGEVRHKDPEVCARNLKRKRLELEKALAAHGGEEVT